MIPKLMQTVIQVTAGLLPAVAALLLVTAITVCGESSEVDVMQRAVAIESADECHLCGMIIRGFPGPKGEQYTRGQARTQKFCSTRDLFAFLLQPENIHRAARVFVHDMAVAPWESPDDNAFIDARSAFYVVNHSQQGAMGPTLASFKTEADARQFSGRFGGRVIGFADITLELLSGLTPGTASAQ